MGFVFVRLEPGLPPVREMLALRQRAGRDRMEELSAGPVTLRRARELKNVAETTPTA